MGRGICYKIGHKMCVTHVAHQKSRNIATCQIKINIHVMRLKIGPNMSDGRPSGIIEMRPNRQNSICASRTGTDT